MIESAVERLAKASPGMEIWLDASPLVFGEWAANLAHSFPPAERARVAAQVARLFSADDPATGVLLGCTTNPLLSLAAVKSDPQYWNRCIGEIIASQPGIGLPALSWRTYEAVIRRSAEMMLPLWEASHGRYGFVSAQLDPRLASQTGAMCRQASQIASFGPNVIVKVPASREGIEVVRHVMAEGISTNVTTCFTMSQMMAAARAARQGLEIARGRGMDTSRCRSVITYFMARLIERPELLREAEERGIELTEIDRKWFGIALFKRACELMREGGYPSKLLLCSLRRGPWVNGRERFWDIEEFAGGDVILTLSPGLLELLFELDGNLVFDPEAIRRPVPRASLDKVLKLPYARSAYEPDGLTPEQFDAHPAMVHMLEQFCSAVTALEDHLGRRLALST